MSTEERNSLIRQRDAALRALVRFDNADKGSRWITHSEEGRALHDRLQEYERQIEQLDEICVACWYAGPDQWDTCPGPDHDTTH